MGTHPIFESDFDCLTEVQSMKLCFEEIHKKYNNCDNEILILFFIILSDNFQLHLVKRNDEMTQKCVNELKKLIETANRRTIFNGSILNIPTKKLCGNSKLQKPRIEFRNDRKKKNMS